MNLLRTVPFLLAAGVVLVAACGDDTAASKPSCDAIIEACHPSTTALGLDCHEFSEDAATTEAQCAERKDECLTECEGAGGGGTGGGGTGGAGGGAGGASGGAGGAAGGAGGG